MVTISGWKTFASGTSIGATAPDSITTAHGTFFVEYGNGADSTGAGGSSTIVQYDSSGKVERTYTIAGSVDGLKYNPYTGQIWALQGDVFLVRGAGAANLQEGELWDISAAGRNVAKAAYYGAGAATVDEEYVQQMVAAPPAVEVAAEPGAFDIRQQAVPNAAGGQGQARA